MISLLSSLSGLEGFIIALSAIVALLLSLTFHEFGHAFVANSQGDPTARLMGRLTFNPFKHLDFMGTLCLLFFGFGWAKPVPVNTINFKQHYKRSLFLVSVAGVIVNIITAFFSCALWFVCVRYLDAGNLAGVFLTSFFEALTLFNITFFLFNLIPIYPLDGFNVLLSISRYQSGYVRLNLKYGSFLLIAFLIFNGFTYVSWVASYIIDGFGYVWGWIL